MFGVDVRESAGAWVLVLLGLLIMWIGFTGQVAPFLGALLTPGQMMERSDADIAAGGVAAARAGGR